MWGESVKILWNLDPSSAQGIFFFLVCFCVQFSAVYCSCVLHGSHREWNEQYVEATIEIV